MTTYTVTVTGCSIGTAIAITDHLSIGMPDGMAVTMSMDTDSSVHRHHCCCTIHAGANVCWSCPIHSNNAVTKPEPVQRGMSCPGGLTPPPA